MTFLIDMGTEENTQGRSLLHCAQDYSEIKTPGCIVSALLKCEKGPMMLNNVDLSTLPVELEIDRVNLRSRETKTSAKSRWLEITEFT